MVFIAAVVGGDGDDMLIIQGRCCGRRSRRSACRIRLRGAVARVATASVLNLKIKAAYGGEEVEVVGIFGDVIGDGSGGHGWQTETGNRQI